MEDQETTTRKRGRKASEETEQPDNGETEAPESPALYLSADQVVKMLEIADNDADKFKELFALIVEIIAAQSESEEDPVAQQKKAAKAIAQTQEQYLRTVSPIV